MLYGSIYAEDHGMILVVYMKSEKHFSVNCKEIRGHIKGLKMVKKKWREEI